MKKILSMTLVLLMVLGMVGCAPQAPAQQEQQPEVSAASGGDEDKVITYVTLGDTGLDLLEQAAVEFEQMTGYKVQFESWSYSDAYSKILTLAEGGNMPDAMYGFSSWIVQFKEAGYTVCVDDLISEELYNDFSQAARDVCAVDGELWAMPSYMSVRSLLVNDPAFQEAGVAIPTTWDELLAAAPALCEGSTCEYAFSMIAGHPKNTLDVYLPLLWSYGAEILSPDGKTVAFNTPEGVASLQMYVDLAQYSVPDYGEATGNEMQNNFTSQTAAAYIHNGQGLAALKKAGEDYSWASIQPPLAGPGGEAYTLGVMDVDLIFNTGKQEIAAQFLELWHQAKYQGEVINAAGYVPNQKSYFEQIPAFTDPANALVEPFAVLEPTAKFKPSITCWEEIQKVMVDYITKAVFGQMTAEEAFAAAEVECNEILAAQ